MTLPHREPRLAEVTDEVEALAQRLVRDELLRWAGEIHDGLTQTTAAAILELEVLAGLMDHDPEGARAMVAGSVLQLRGAMADVREVLFHLTDEGPRTTDLMSTIEEARARWDMDITVTHRGPMNVVPTRTAASACLILREALANAAKHARQTSVAVDISVANGAVRLIIGDDGPGSLPASRDGHHFGVRFMERCAMQAGGTIEVAASPSGGTMITATLPHGVTR